MLTPSTLEHLVAPLRIIVGDLVGVIERRQRGLDSPQEEMSISVGLAESGLVRRVQCSDSGAVREIELRTVEGVAGVCEVVDLNYDLLAQRVIRYGYVYLFAEALGGILMIAGVLVWFAAPLMRFTGGVGAVSVFKAVYINVREIECACVGGNSNVPLGFVSLTENLAMGAKGLWMLVR